MTHKYPKTGRRIFETCDDGQFLAAFGIATLRDLSDIEAPEDAECSVESHPDGPVGHREGAVKLTEG